MATQAIALITEAITKIRFDIDYIDLLTKQPFTKGVRTN
jgi:hypothetical protein